MPVYKIPESVLVVIHSIDLQVLLIERTDKPGFWQSVTGSKDLLDEPLQVTAIREVFEETGIAIGSEQVPLANLCDWQLSNVYTIYPTWRHRYAPGVTQNTEHVFGLCVPRDITITLAPREHLQINAVNHNKNRFWDFVDGHRSYGSRLASALCRYKEKAGGKPASVGTYWGVRGIGVSGTVARVVGCPSSTSITGSASGR